jgi:hypothetical protein
MKRLLLITVTLLAMLLPTSAVLAGTPYQVGDVFVGIGNGQIEQYDNDGNYIQTLDNLTSSTEQTGMAFDSAGFLLTTNFSNHSMSEFDNDGDLVGPFASGYSFNYNPESVVFDSAGDVYVGQVDGSPSRLTKLDRGGNLIQEYFPTIEDRGIDWIDLAADQTTVFYTSEGYKIMRYDVSADTQLADFTTLPERPAYALRIRSNGEVLVAATNNAYRLDSSGALMQTYPKPAGETSFLFALNLDPDGTSFWTAGYFTGNVYKIDIDSGAVLTQFTANPYNSVAGLAIYGEPTAATEIPVDIDIHPQSCPNPINMKSKGVLPVAILGTEDLDVIQIAPETVKLTMEGLEGGVSPLRWSLEDVATPYTDDEDGCYACTEEGADGYLDLTLKFKTQEVVTTLGLGEFDDGECVILKLTGNLKEEFEGTPFSGEDVVKIILK